MILNLTKSEWATIKAVIGEIDGLDFIDIMKKVKENPFCLTYNPNIELAKWESIHSAWNKMHTADNKD